MDLHDHHLLLSDLALSRRAMQLQSGRLEEADAWQIVRAGSIWYSYVFDPESGVVWREALLFLESRGSGFLAVSICVCSKSTLEVKILPSHLDGSRRRTDQGKWKP
jgi:hypothetical protein